MAVTTLRPNAAGDKTQLTPVGESNNWETVDESSSDGDTTYVKTPAGGFATRGDLYEIEAATDIGDSDTISQIEVFLQVARGSNWSNDEIAVKIKENSTETNDTTAAPSSTSYEEFSKVYTTRPSDGSSWTKSDISNLQIGIHMSSGNLGDDDLRCTQVYVEVTHTEPEEETTDPGEGSSGSSGASQSGILGEFQKQKQYLFIIETDSGEQRGMTENWDFGSITREINGGMTVTLTTDETVSTFVDGKTDINNAVIVRVATDKTGPEGLDYYSGYVAQRDLILSGQEEKITLRSFGHISKLYRAVWRDGTTVTHNFQAGDSTTNIIKDIIDDYRTLDSNFRVNYDSDSVENTGDTVKTKFELNTFGEALESVASLAHTDSRIWYWRVLGDNVFTFKKSSTGPDHSLIMGKDISNLSLNEDLVNAINEVFIYYNNNTLERASDSDNIDSKGYLSEVIRETNVTDSTTAEAISNATLESRLAPLLKISVTVNDNYVNGIEFIDPGDTVEILNLPIVIDNLLTSNMLVTKTTYRKDEVDLELSIKHPRLDASVETLRRKFEKSRSEGTPTTFSNF